jgi:methyl-accepting chemotaxis protein
MLNKGEFVAGRFERIDSRGQTVWLEATYNPVYDTEGALCKVVKFATVVTDQVTREQEVSEAAQTAFEISQQTDVSAQRGAVVVNDTMHTMRKIAVDMQAASGGVEALGKQSLLISSIIQTISSIAQQTNLLALNVQLKLLAQVSRVEDSLSWQMKSGNWLGAPAALLKKLLLSSCRTRSWSMRQ